MSAHARTRRSAGVLAAVLAASAGAFFAPGQAAAAPPGIVVEDGATQPVFSLASAINETVHVESDMDSDGDGQLDTITVQLIRPAETATGLQVASIVKASPYWTVQSPGARRSTVIDPIGDPDTHWGGWLDEYFVPRGYAVLEVEIAGTGTSDGCLSVGGESDERSVAAVVDWLNGRTTATYANGTAAVASWSTGNVGMYGVSYDGTLAIQLAETGIDGLKTIVPVGAISSWYDYTRAQGIGYRSWSVRYMEGFTSRRANAQSLVNCTAQYQAIGDGETLAEWDYSPFFAARNYRDDVDQVQASVFLVHGQRDDNVKTTQWGRYWDELVAHDVPRKVYLHDGEHVDPFGNESKDPVGRWMDHWLYGIANGVMDEPQATIARPDGTRVTETVWPPASTTDTSLYLGPAGNGGAGSLTTSAGTGSQQFTSSGAVAESTMLASPGTVQSYRLAYLGPTLTSASRLSGAARIEVAFTSATTSTPLTALLVHYTGGSVTRVVARGSLDAKNRLSLTTGTPLTPGQPATGTVLLEPKDYVFPAGSQIGLVLTGNLNAFVHSDPLAGQVTVALGTSRAVLPLTVAPAPVCTDPAWSPTAIYNTNDVVSHNGHRWRAQWWTQNQEPGTTGQYGVWVDLGAC
ncbi:CocE/NonD family hydrolase [Micromonospora lutea]|uniref:Xaa-Pro dipeptidyl-peptidase n=1 Tax=Micromonospora lutea TaxID=419825 RepID=A0ABQ4IPR6_9ACTN|nr:CocE/NonD family hydrolase [Micromonospora lutea]GIJ19904.1 putative Xaa-Pro dipeptidyl-peptidase [Micromonospora lutea]